MSLRRKKRPAFAAVVVAAVAVVFVAFRSTAAPAKADSALRNSEWLVKAWQTEDGLPENSATAMVQTPDGYLWFGTFNGLVRFDGVKFTVFDQKNTPELPSSSIVNLHLDKRGRLWISTYRGLVLHEGTHWQVLTREEVDQNEFVHTFTERDNGDLLLTKFNGRIVEFSNGQLTALPPPPGDPSRGYAAYVDEIGQWWVVQNRFIGRWDGHEWAPTIPVTTVPASVGCAKAQDGGLWLLQDAELRKYSRGREVYHLRLAEMPGGCWNMTEDSRGNVWVCTYDKGLCQVSADGRMQRWDEDHGLTYHGVRFAYEDTENNIWIGTSGGGLVRFKPRRFQSFGVEQGLSEHVVKSVWPASRGGLWIATYGQGLFHLGATGVSSVQIPAWTSEHYGQSVLTDKTGRTWLGTYGDGLWVSGRSGFDKIPFEQTGGNNVVALFEDSRGRIWLSGGQEVSVFDSRTFHVYAKEQGLSPSGVCCFGEDRNHVLWLSNLRGLFRLEKARFAEVHDRENRSIPDIACIQSDADNCLWLGSLRDGLLRYRNGSFSRIGREAGLPVTSVHGIIEDNDGFFWLTSNRGVVHARRKDLEAAAEGGGDRLFCQLLGLSDGLPSVECTREQQPTCAKDVNGKLWFATLKGVAMADPARFKINTHPPPVKIEEVIYHIRAEPGAEQARTERHEQAPFVDGLKLPAGSHNIEIHYTALSFTSPDKVRFRVRLRSRGPEWQDVGDRRVAYFDELRPGENVFQVRAANDDGVWNEAGASLAFVVAPLFWQTTWFRAVAWGAVIGEAILIIALMRAMERRRKARLELRERLDFERLISELSRVFINLPPEKLGAQIMEALRQVAEKLKFDIATLATFAGGDGQERASFLWRSPGVKEIACDRMEEQLPWSANELAQGRDVWLPAVSKLPPEAVTDRATYEKYGVHSSYQVPLYSGGVILASLGLCSVGERREPTHELLQRQKLIGEVLINALERNRAEERRRESERRFRIVADSAPVMIWMSGVDKLCTFFNKTWLDFTGRTVEQELGNGWAEGVHHTDFERCLQSYIAAFDARKPFLLQYRLRRHDGEYRWVSDSGVPRYDDQGGFAGYIGSCVDVTERREAEERMSLAAEAANLGMWIWDIPLNKIWATDKFRELFSFAAGEDITLERIQARVHPQDRERRKLALQRALETGGSYDLEYRLVSGAGEERWLASKGHAEKDEQGQPARVLGVYMDITERRRTEEQAREVSGRLITAQEDERTRLARELHDDLSQSLALLSVDLDLFGQQRPEAGMVGGIRMEELAKQVKSLSSEVHRLSHELHPSKLEQLGLVAALRSYCNDMAGAHQIAVQFDSQGAPRELPDSVALCLYRVTQEAVQNVVKHSGATAVRISLVAGNGEIGLTIADDGRGFDVNVAQHSGSLGLVSMRERARLVNGQIVVESRKGQGTRVELRVPLVGNPVGGREPHPSPRSVEIEAKPD